MVKPTINGFSELAQLLIHKYESYLPTAFDESLSLLQKVNKIIKYLDETGAIVNSVVKQWNETMEWVMSDGLNESVIGKLNEMLANGQFDELINVSLFNGLDSKIKDLKKAKFNIVNVIEHFNAKGDGIADDTKALQDAIDYVTSSTFNPPLYFPAGYRFKITQPLVSNKSITMFTDDSNRAEIYSPNQNINLFEASGSLIKSVALTKGVTVSTKMLDVLDASGIVEGDLLTLISSKSWYHDARSESTDARKAELHRVEEVISNKVFVTDLLFDGYDLNKESVIVNFYRPIKVNIYNLDFRMEKYPGNTDTVRKVTVVLDYTIDSKIINVNTYNSQNAGMSVKHSYRPLVDGGIGKGHNNYFSGYGLQFVGTTHAITRNRFYTNCRRGVDVSGFQVPSHMTIVEGNTCIGSGSNSMGVRYVYETDHTTGSYAGGFGTHGPADHTVIRNNRVGFLHTGFIDRGRSTTFEDNIVVGDLKEALFTSDFGENLTIKGTTVDDGFTGVKETALFDGGANINTRKPPIFLRIYSDSIKNQSMGQGWYRIEDNYAMIQHTFIEFYGAAGDGVLPTLKNLIVKNNHVMFTPQAGSEKAYMFSNNTVDNGSVLISGSQITGNTYKRLSGAGGVQYWNKVDPRSKSQIESPQIFTLYMTNGTVETINVGVSLENAVRVGIDSANAHGLIKVTQGATYMSEWSTPVRVSAFSGVLTGTTGTDGNLNVSLQDGVLYIENRLGATRRISVTVFAVM